MTDRAVAGPIPVPEAPIRVMLVDDHEVLRRGVRALLEAAGGIVVCGEAGGVAEAVEVAKVTEPELVLMDVRLADGSGIEATREIRSRRSDVRVLMLTSFGDADAVLASIMAGASGYVLKEIKGDSLIEAVRTVGRGGSLFDSHVTSAVLDRVRKSLVKDEKLSRLSPQEERILKLVAEGKTNTEIAMDLHLATKTVKNYVSAILGKLEMSRRSEAAAYFAKLSPRTV